MCCVGFGVNPNECFGSLVERTHGATRQRLNAVSDLAQRQCRKGRCACCGQLCQHAGVDARCTVRSCTDQCAQRLAQTIGHFLSHVLDSLVDGGCQRQRGEVRVIGVLQMCLGLQRSRCTALTVTREFGLYLNRILFCHLHISLYGRSAFVKVVHFLV